MLKAFVDDSAIGQPPVSVLGGWIAPADTWAKFSDDWDSVLRMSPRIEYFKLKEALGFSGQFYGMSERSRDEKLRLLMRTIEDHKLMAVYCCIPDFVYKGLFAAKFGGIFKNPYFHCFYGLIIAILNHFNERGLSKEKINFVFDEQRTEMLSVMSAWNAFAEFANSEESQLLGDTPTFSNDLDTLPLQAADLVAGWLRLNAIAILKGEKIKPIMPWGDIGSSLPYIECFWTPEAAEEIHRRLFGWVPRRVYHIGPVPVSFKYGYDYEP